MVLAATFLAAMTAMPVPAAADGGARQESTHSAVRLIAGEADPATGRAVLRAGVEITLARGWKTYWRYPGDSGVPPRFDFSRSTNVKAVSVMWPAPIRFSDGGGTSIGYADRVVLPLKVEPADPAAQTTLDLHLDYAICERLCVPDSAQVRLQLPRLDLPRLNPDMATPADIEQAATLAASEARVPVPAALGADGPVAVVAVRRQEGGAHPRVEVDVRAAANAAVDLFAEGPIDGWNLPLPLPVADAPAGIRRFAFDLDGLPPGASPERAALRLTAVAGPHAVETLVETASPLE